MGPQPCNAFGVQTVSSESFCFNKIDKLARVDLLQIGEQIKCSLTSTLLDQRCSEYSSNSTIWPQYCPQSQRQVLQRINKEDYIGDH